MAQRRTKIRRRPWRTSEITALCQYSVAKTPVVIVAKEMKRTPGALRQQAHVLKIPLGHYKKRGAAQ